MSLKLGPLKKLTWTLGLLFTLSLLAELYALFTEVSDQLSLLQQTATGLKLVYIVPFIPYTLSLIFNRSELVLLYLILCLHCASFDFVLVLCIARGLFVLRDLNLLMTFLVFECVQIGLALLTFVGSLGVYVLLKKGAAPKHDNIFDRYAFTRFRVYNEKDWVL